MLCHAQLLQRRQAQGKVLAPHTLGRCLCPCVIASMPLTSSTFSSGVNPERPDLTAACACSARDPPPVSVRAALAASGCLAAAISCAGAPQWPAASAKVESRTTDTAAMHAGWAHQPTVQTRPAGIVTWSSHLHSVIPGIPQHLPSQPCHRCGRLLRSDPASGANSSCEHHLMQ